MHLRRIPLVFLGVLVSGSPPTMAQSSPGSRAADRFGDPLPAGAMGRLGTVRFRHPSWVSALAYSPDGNVLASACWDAAVRLWDPSTGKESRAFRRQPDPNDRGAVAFLGLAISGDGKRLVAMENHDVVHIWDLESGKELSRLKGRNGFGLALSPDGKTLAKGIGGDGGKQVALWDLATGQPIREFGAANSPVRAVAFSPDGTVIASGDGAFTKGGPPSLAVRVWDRAIGRQLLQLEGHRSPITSVAFSPDGKVLVSTSHDATIRFWGVGNGRPLRMIKVPEDSYPPDINNPDGRKGVEYGGVLVVKFSPDGRLLASGGYDGTVRIWEVNTGKELHTLRGHGAQVVALAFSPKGDTLASGSFDHAIRLWDLASGKELQPREGHDGPVYAVTVSPDGRLVAAACSDRTVCVWSLPKRERVQTLRGHTGAIFSLTFSPDSQMIASASADQSVRVWQVAEGREVRKLSGHTGSVYSVALIPPGKMLASSGSDQTIRFWDWSPGRELRQIKGEKCFQLHVSSDGRLLSYDGYPAQLWDIATGKPLRRIGGLWAHFAFMPDGRTCVTEEQDGMFHFWDAASGDEIYRFPGPGHSIAWAGVPSFLISSDGRLLARQHGSVVQLWELATGKVRRALSGHQGRVSSLAFSPDGRVLVSGSDDTTILIWDLARRQESAQSPLTHPELQALWADLGGDNAERADRAVFRLVARAAESVPLLKSKLRPAAVADAEQVSRLIADLDNNQFAVRQKAGQDLERLHEKAAPALRKALAQSPSLETRRRIEQLLAKLPRPPLTASEPLRAVEVLEHIATIEAKDILEALTKGNPEARLTIEARSALNRLRK